MPVLIDTSILVNAMRRGGDSSLLLLRWAGKDPVWLSSVALHELYTGADSRGFKNVEKLEDDFAGVGRVLVPELGDWIRAGKILARIGHKYGYELVGRARLTNDALIAVSAARTGMKVITANKRDFELLAEYCPLKWQEQPDFRA